MILSGDLGQAAAAKGEARIVDGKLKGHNGRNLSENWSAPAMILAGTGVVGASALAGGLLEAKVIQPDAIKTQATNQSTLYNSGIGGMI